jgi:uncharacterized membrane protein
MRISQYKKISKDTLKGFWFNAFFALSVLSIITYFISFFVQQYVQFTPEQIELLFNGDDNTINEFDNNLIKNLSVIGISFVLTIVLVNPLKVGILRFLYNKVTKTPLGVSDIFEYFSSAERFFKVFVLDILLTIRVFFKSIIALLPLIICAAAYGFALEYSPKLLETLEMQALAVFATSIAFILFVIFMIRIVIRYSLLFFVLIDKKDQNITNKEIFKLSKKAIKGNYGKYFLLALSFLPWLLLVLVITAFGIKNPIVLIISNIVAIFVSIYLYTTICVFAKHKISTLDGEDFFAEYNKNIEAINAVNQNSDEINLENKDVK